MTLTLTAEICESHSFASTTKNVIIFTMKTLITFLNKVNVHLKPIRTSLLILSLRFFSSNFNQHYNRTFDRFAWTNGNLNKTSLLNGLKYCETVKILTFIWVYNNSLQFSKHKKKMIQNLNVEKWWRKKNIENVISDKRINNSKWTMTRKFTIIAKAERIRLNILYD